MDVVALFAAHGAARYGETVTQLEHTLQCAALARRERTDDEIVLAALLHDVGHLVTRAPEGPAMAGPAIVSVLRGNRLT
jgi:predicted HD phosphohydrolase